MLFECAGVVGFKISVSFHCSRVDNVEDGTLRTIECLRGRLDAERQASRDAEQKAQLITNKV